VTGAIQWISPSVRHQFGQEPDDLIGTPYERLFNVDDEQAASWLTARLAEDPTAAYRVELRCRNADGSFRWHELVVQNLLDDPDAHGVVINQRDITEASPAREQLTYQATHDDLTGIGRPGPVRPRTGGSAAARRGRDAVLLTGLEDEAGAIAVARRISATIQSPLQVAGQVLLPSSSIGVVAADPRACAAGVLLHRSDVAVYHAKRSGDPWGLYHLDLEMTSSSPPVNET